uniref:Uncharacterized protein n=1 Tax=Sphaerodactylus townsendi TaxID=933632 RepID=A0ACB8GED8_9SAUR
MEDEAAPVMGTPFGGGCVSAAPWHLPHLAAPPSPGPHPISPRGHLHQVNPLGNHVNQHTPPVAFLDQCLHLCNDSPGPSPLTAGEAGQRHGPLAADCGGWARSVPGCHGAAVKGQATGPLVVLSSAEAGSPHYWGSLATIKSPLHGLSEVDASTVAASPRPPSM